VNHLDAFYPMFAAHAKKFGVQAAVGSLQGAMSLEDAEELALRYSADVAKIESGGPAIIAAGKEAWYSGPTDPSVFWEPLRDLLADEGWVDERMSALDRASSVVVAHTPRSDAQQFLSKGLVVGYVQSGKTTNFTAVIAKMADEEYRLVIVLSGIHNGLRKQTQLRLQAQLQDPLPDKWHLLTDETRDFTAPTSSPLVTLNGDRPALAIVKKNAAVLRRLVKWLESQPGQQALRKISVLIVDDEADQASVATGAINPLIRRLIKLAKRCTYIGYTATPFANVFIDPASEDLYPSDFILNLPLPEGYFGPEVLFGREHVEGDDDGPAPDGHDMIRLVPDHDLDDLRPVNTAAAAGFKLKITAELRASITWFWLATAARRARGDRGHSTMLVHTSVRIGVHDAYRKPIEDLRDEYLARLTTADVLDELRSQWEIETAAVPAEELGATPTEFDELVPHLEEVIASTRLILDNYRSKDRLNYGDEPVVAIAVGGNTLSRGLTLEGLVVSFFVRSANAYDTLLQMGRWFGFRPKYQDLPRIWMTDQLRLAFRHLATVEAEMRQDIEDYQTRGLTPMDVAVRVKTHPSLRITAKMGAAQPHYISYAGRRLQTRFFDLKNEEVQEENWRAADQLLSSALEYGTLDEAHGALLVRDVPARLIIGFLAKFAIHPDAPDLDTELMSKYIEHQIGQTPGSLETWSIAVVGGGGAIVTLAGRSLASVVRSQLDDGRPDRADIKTLMSKQDRVLDLDISAADAKALDEVQLLRKRNEHPIYKSRGLLVLYPIESVSAPLPGSKGRVALDSPVDVMGLGFVFPGEAAEGSRIAASHVAVDLTGVEVVDPEEYEDDTETEVA
jgi:hypothetical protein